MVGLIVTSGLTLTEFLRVYLAFDLLVRKCGKLSAGCVLGIDLEFEDKVLPEVIENSSQCKFN